MGLACKEGNLFRVFLKNGGSVLTHGGDPAPAGAVPDAPETSRYEAYTWPGQVKPDCVKSTSREFYGHVIYARASDRPDRYRSKLTEIRSLINVANGIVYYEGKRFGRRSSFRMRCVGSTLAVSRLTLSTRHNATNFSSIVNDAILAGYSDIRAKYWIYYDGHPPGAAAGTATFRGDSSRSAENVSNYGAQWAVDFGYGLNNGGPHIMLHEAGHNLGAVQNNAPHSTLAAHCFDGPDTMCYNDGGALAYKYSANYCSTYHFDCGNNDYYNPRPKSGSYLSKHWNLGSPLNRFIAGCQFTVGSIVAPSTGDVPDSRFTAERGVSKSCWSRSFALSGVEFTAYDAARSAARWAFDRAEWSSWWTGQSPSREILGAHVPDLSVCFYKGTRKLRCYETEAAEAGTVPYGATKMKIWMVSGADATYFFNAV